MAERQSSRLLPRLLTKARASCTGWICAVAVSMPARHSSCVMLTGSNISPCALP
jgi:hypothetical protein